MQMHTKQTRLYCTDIIIYMFQLMTAAIIRLITKTQNMCTAALVVRDRVTYTRVVTQYTHLLTPWSRVLLEKLTGFQLVKKFPAFYGTRRFITAFTSASHLPYSETDRSSPYPHIPLPKDPSYIIFLSTPVSSKWRLSLRFPHQNPVYASPLSHTCYMLHPFHSSWFDHPNDIGWGVQISINYAVVWQQCCHTSA